MISTFCYYLIYIYIVVVVVGAVDNLPKHITNAIN